MDDSLTRLRLHKMGFQKKRIYSRLQELRKSWSRAASKRLALSPSPLLEQEWLTATKLRQCAVSHFSRKRPQSTEISHNQMKHRPEETFQSVFLRNSSSSWRLCTCLMTTI